MSEPTPRSSQVSEDLTLGWNVLAGEPSASPRSTRTPAPSSPSDGPESPTSGIFSTSGRGWWNEGTGTLRADAGGMEQTGHLLISGPAASPARISASPESDE